MRCHCSCSSTCSAAGPDYHSSQQQQPKHTVSIKNDSPPCTAPADVPPPPPNAGTDESIPVVTSSDLDEILYADTKRCPHLKVLMQASEAMLKGEGPLELPWVFFYQWNGNKWFCRMQVARQSLVLVPHKPSQRSRALVLQPCTAAE